MLADKVGLATYGAVNSGLTSIANGDSWLETTTKTALGAGVGHVGGKLLGTLSNSGASLPLIKVAETTIETAFDTAVDIINGNKVTKETVGSDLAINAAFNLPVVKTGKVTKYSNLSDQEIAEKFVKGLEDTTYKNSIAKNFQSSGGYDKVLEDFNSLGLSNIKEISILKLAAGVAQEISDIKTMGFIEADWKAFKSFLAGNYFDNPGDSQMIQDGIDAYKQRNE